LGNKRALLDTWYAVGAVAPWLTTLTAKNPDGSVLKPSSHAEDEVFTSLQRLTSDDHVKYLHPSSYLLAHTRAQSSADATLSPMFTVVARHDLSLCNST